VYFSGKLIADYRTKTKKASIAIIHLNYNKRESLIKALKTGNGHLWQIEKVKTKHSRH
jgi:hypothetical protein